MNDFTELDELQELAPDSEKQLTKGQRIERWLLERWQFRYNEVKNVSEYQRVGTKKWRSLDDYFLNSVKRQLRDEWYWEIEGTDDSGEPKRKKKYLNTSVAELQQTIESEFSPKQDVIKTFLNGLDYNNYSGNAIEQLANTVKLANWYSDEEKKYWHKYLEKWLVGTVANSMEDENCKNHLCLVLVGSQGLRKGFWIEHLVQDSLGAQYIRTDGDFSPYRKDCMAAIGTYWVIHLDDMLKRINDRDYNEIKNAITTPDIKVRLPYARKDSVLPHRASFIATVNDREFLTDTTGARRFIPFEIESIDYDAYQKINKAEIWTNAMKLYKEGFYYWVDGEEERSLEAYKKNFKSNPTEQDLLTKYFRPFVEGFDWMKSPTEGKPGEGGKKGEYLTATEIIGELMEKSMVFRNLSTKRLGGILREFKFEKKSKWRVNQSIWCYPVVRLDPERDAISDTNEFD